MAKDERDMRQVNRERIVEYYRRGAKPREDCVRLGVEVEHFVLGPHDEPICYEPHDGFPGVSDILDHLRTYYPKQDLSAEGAVIALEGEEGSVTLEPAAQLELSCAPYSSIADIERAFGHFYQHVNEYLEPRGCHLSEWGYHPTRKALDLPLIPKRRYEFMNEYFAHVHTHGERMMRTSASTQVSVDYWSEADAVRKMRVAAAIAPVLAAIMDNTRVFEAEPNGTPIRRFQLWREVDNRRCCTPRGLFDDGYGFGDYADWLLDTSPIFVDRPAASDPDGPDLRPFYDTTAAQAYADAPMSRHDIQHLISMFWPDVRLKNFVEIRPADSVPLPVVLGYAALVRGIFYSDASLATIEDAVGVQGDHWPITADDVNACLHNIQDSGFAGEVYGKPLVDWEDTLFSIAREALPENERRYLDSLVAFAGDKGWWHLSA